MKQRAALPPDKREFLLPVFRLGHWLFLPSDRNYTISSPGSPAVLTVDLGLVSLYNPIGSIFLEDPD